ncbi:MAG TPA: DUF4214 domain-containing protein [Myxococcales bacterium]|nr:DUF4214 domain-containing protein [Myxococcales bacterium]
MSSAAFDPQRHPRRLNLGCGFDKKEGWLNVDFQDFHAPDLVADVTRLTVLPSGYYEEILAQDILEHIGRTETRNVLSEWNRVLRMKGVLRLRVPSIVGVAELLQRRDHQTVEKQEHLVQCLFGSQRYGGDFHYTGFTELLLREYLKDTGFDCAQLKREGGWLLDAVAVKVKDAAVDALYRIEDDAAFVAELYRKVLRREPDGDGLQFYVGKLSARQLTRTAVHEILAQSPEARALAPR